MQIKRYEAVNMREAMAKIRKELGSDAVILSTKKISEDSSLIEVVAAREQELVNHEINSSSDIAVQSREGNLDSLKQDMRELKSFIDSLSQQLMFKTDLLDLKETLNMLCDNISVRNEAHLHDLYRMLIDNGFSRARALRLTETIKSEYPRTSADTPEKAVTLAEYMLARSFPVDNRREGRIKAFVGPTGVGKTTTLAKLAAHYCLDKKMKVGLITTDTYRIAAPEQLKVYAGIMGLPLQVASEKTKFMQSLAKFADRDLILVDTPGRSRQDDHFLSILKSILTEDVDTFLLLSPTASREHMIETADRFRILDYDRLILTKLDDCRNFGAVVDVIDAIGKPVSYLTTGQNVPQDIETANPQKLAQLTLQNILH